MKIEDEIYVNKSAQGLVDRNCYVEWFLDKTADEQEKILIMIGSYIHQAHATGKHALEAINKASIPLNCTPCQIMKKEAYKNLLGTASVNQALAKIRNLPKSEYKYGFILMLTLLGLAIADRPKEKDDLDRWWLGDLSDAIFIRKVIIAKGMEK